MNLFGTLTLAGGIFLIYGAVKDKSPAQILKDLMANNGKSSETGMGASLQGIDMAPPKIQRTGN